MSRMKITHREYQNRCLNQGHGMHAKPGYVRPLNQRGYHIQTKPVNKVMNPTSPTVQVKTETRSFEDFLSIAMLDSSKLMRKVLG